MDKACSGEVFARLAGLDFETEKVQLDYQGVPVSDVYGIRVVGEEQPMPGVSVGSVFECLRPYTLVEIGEAVRLHDPGAYWDTGGSLFDRRRVWALLRLSGEVHVIRHGKGGGAVDITEPYLLLSTSMDGSRATDVQRTGTRVVCQNTLNMATAAMAHGARIKHTASQTSRIIETVESLLSESIKLFEHGADFAQQLADTPMSMEQARSFFAQLVTNTENIEDATAELRKAKDAPNSRRWTGLQDTASLLTQLFQSGQGNYGQDKYDALNAVTEFVDHHRARIRKYKGANATLQANTQFESTQFGSGADFKARAIKLLR